MPSISFFFTDTATTEISTLSLHDALPISRDAEGSASRTAADRMARGARAARTTPPTRDATAARRAPPRVGSRKRSEEHTSELQSQSNIVCRLLLEKKKRACRRDACTCYRP